MKKYILPGEKITSLERFYEILGEVINGPEGYFGDNLDALIDCLRGGFGTPYEFIIIWKNSKISRSNLGYSETIDQLNKRLEHCHPSNRKIIQDEIKEAKKQKGKTVFDWLIEIFDDAPNVFLELEF